MTTVQRLHIQLGRAFIVFIYTSVTDLSFVVTIGVKCVPIKNGTGRFKEY